MDQSPLPFEHQKGRTYTKLGSKTVTLKGARNWVKHQYSTASAYPLRDHEPRLPCLDAFAPHKNQGRKTPKTESQQAVQRRLAEEKLQQDLRDELAKLNVTTSLIPGGCTPY